MSSKIESFIEDHGELLILCLSTLVLFPLSWLTVNQIPYSIENGQEDIFTAILFLGLLLLCILWVCLTLRILDSFGLLPAADRVVVFVVIAAFIYCIIGLLQCISAQMSYAWLRQNTRVSYSLSGDAYRVVKKESYCTFLNSDGSTVNYSLNDDRDKIVLNNSMATIDNNLKIPAININGQKQDTTTYLWGLSEKEAYLNKWNLILDLAPKSISISNSTNVTFVNVAATKVLNLTIES